MSEEGNEEDKLKIRKTEEPQPKRRKLTRQDAIWILPLIGAIIAIIIFWGLIGLVITTIGIIAMLAGIFLLAKENLLFSSLAQMSAIAIMYGAGDKARLHRLIISDHTGIHAEDADGNKIEPLWFEKAFNIWWLGIPFLGRVYEFTLHIVKEEREETIGEKGHVEVKEIRRITDVTFDHISLKEEVYAVIMPPILCADNFDVIIDIAIYNEVVDAKKALFSIGNFLRAIITEIEMTIRSDVGKKHLDELKAQQAEISEIIFNRLKEKGEIGRIKNDWGLNLKATGIRDITPEPEARAIIKEKAFAAVKADARKEEGRGEKEYQTEIGTGEAARLTARYDAIKAFKTLGKHLRELDVSEEYAKGPNKMIISMAEISQFLNRAHTQKSTLDTNGINTEAIKSIIPMLTAAGITALTLEQIANITEALSEGKSLSEILKTLTEQQEEEEQ